MELCLTQKTDEFSQTSNMLPLQWMDRTRTIDNSYRERKDTVDRYRQKRKKFSKK